MDNEILVKTIKTTCKNFGITVAQLEKELGYSPSLISRWTKTSPSVDKIVEIADYFNIHIDDLIGRKIKSNNVTSEQFIDKLFNMTVDRSLEWNDRTQFIQEMETDENFYLEDAGYDSREMFVASYNKGCFWLYAQYSEEKGNISDSYIEIYIQPDSNSKIVLQDVDCAASEKLWLYVHTLLFGTLDEIKAEEFKNGFVLNKSLTNSNDVLSKDSNDLDIEIIEKALKNPSVMKLMETYNKPEFQELQRTFSSPEFQKTMQVANRLQRYFEKLNK